MTDCAPPLPETLHELDMLTEELDQVITNLYTWRDQCGDEVVRDTLAIIGDQISGAWALLMHARQTTGDLRLSVRTAPRATTPADAEAQADVAVGRGRHSAPGVSPDTGEWRQAVGYL